MARQMERAEMENAEVAGDDDEEDVDGLGDFSGGEEGDVKEVDGSADED